MVDLSELEATNAIWEAAVLGRKQKLLAYLRSDRPLAAMDRAYLADYQEEKLNESKAARVISHERFVWGSWPS
jgi:hypothetical protein